MTSQLSTALRAAAAGIHPDEAARGPASESLTRFVGCNAYGVQSLRHDLARFTFLLGESDGEGLFSARTRDWSGALLRPSWWVPNATALVRTGPSWATGAWLGVMATTGIRGIVAGACYAV